MLMGLFFESTIHIFIYIYILYDIPLVQSVHVLVAWKVVPNYLNGEAEIEVTRAMMIMLSNNDSSDISIDQHC